MPVRLSSQLQPSNFRLRKRIGLALQLVGTACFALDLCLPQSPHLAALLFALWVFLGYQMQASAQDRECLEAMAARLQTGPQSPNPNPAQSGGTAAHEPPGPANPQPEQILRPGVGG